MIVKCPNCNASYNANERYFGKSFTCPCGATVNVPKPPEPKPPVKPTPKPATPAPKPAPAKPVVPAPAKPEAKPAAPANRRAAVSVEKFFTASSPAQLGSMLLEVRKHAADKMTIYGLLSHIAVVVCVLCEVVAGLGTWKAAEQFPFGGQVVAFFIAFIPIMFLIFFFFIAVSAILRIADCVCRASGIRPTLL